MANKNKNSNEKENNVELDKVFPKVAINCEEQANAKLPESTDKQAYLIEIIFRDLIKNMKRRQFI